MINCTYNAVEHLFYQVKVQNNENMDMHGTNETMSETENNRTFKN